MSAYFESAEYAARDEQMFYYRQLGMPLRLIGEKWKVTTARVHQILAGREQRVSSLEYHEPPGIRNDLATDRSQAHAVRLAHSLLNIG